MKKLIILIILPMIVLAVFVKNARAANPPAKATVISVNQPTPPPDSTITLTDNDIAFIQEIISASYKTPQEKMEEINQYMFRIYSILLEEETLNGMLQDPPQPGYLVCGKWCPNGYKWYKCGTPPPKCSGIGYE
jgi:hypothetical protein